MTSTLDRARLAKRSLRRDLLALREAARPIEYRQLLPTGWHPAQSGLTWAEWLTQLDERSEWNGQVLVPSVVDRMIAEAGRNEAQAKREGTFREPATMDEEQWQQYCAECHARQIARQRGL